MIEVLRPTEKMPRLIIPAVQVILTRKGMNGPEVFLGHRISGAFLHQWSFPGGKIDPGEDSRQAAGREVLEEAGVKILPDNFSVFRYAQSPTVREIGGKKVNCLYQVRAFGADAGDLSPYNASPDEHSVMKWMTVQEALAMHESAVARELATGECRTPDKIPGALAPQTLETIQSLARILVTV